MLILRIAAYLVVAGIGGALLLYAITRERRYLRLAGRLAKWGLVFALVVFALLVLERVVLVPV
ncbi:MAG: hypothetical protein KJ025_13830 [Burkholderiales bacterium]|nr:hypothetical protein [Burkholderiales bacterium]